jgi:hypothetical protein
MAKVDCVPLATVMVEGVYHIAVKAASVAAASAMCSCWAAVLPRTPAVLAIATLISVVARAVTTSEQTRPGVSDRIGRRVSAFSSKFPPHRRQPDSNGDEIIILTP